MSDASPLFASAALERLRTGSFLAELEFHPELPSTNDRALMRCLDPEAKLPALVLAERQTAGRGRGGNAWWAASGALTFSLILPADRHRLSPQRHPQVSLAIALAVGDAVDAVLGSESVRLKWPNDVYLAGRKVCGILVEAPPSRPDVLVIGVGLNVNNAFSDAPAELRSRAASLADVAGRTFDLAGLLQDLLARIDARLFALAQGSLHLPAEWQRRCLLGGRHIAVAAGSQTSFGLCRGIDADGALLLERDGRVQRCYAGVVSGLE